MNAKHCGLSKERCNDGMGVNAMGTWVIEQAYPYANVWNVKDTDLGEASKGGKGGPTRLRHVSLLSELASCSRGKRKL